METLTEGQDKFLIDVFNFLKYLEELTKSQNQMLAMDAVEGRLIASNVLLSNNVLLSMLSELVKNSFAQEYMEYLNEQPASSEEKVLN